MTIFTPKMTHSDTEWSISNSNSIILTQNHHFYPKYIAFENLKDTKDRRESLFNRLH